jgi:hypothetical protein
MDCGTSDGDGRRTFRKIIEVHRSGRNRGMSQPESLEPVFVAQQVSGESDLIEQSAAATDDISMTREIWRAA